MNMGQCAYMVPEPPETAPLVPFIPTGLDYRSQKYFSSLAKGDVSMLQDANMITVCVAGQSIGKLYNNANALRLFESIAKLCKRHGEGCHPKTQCCGYEAPKSQPYPVYWNPHNKVVQCHNCGTIFSSAQPSKSNHA
jgi:hypothetical protein